MEHVTLVDRHMRSHDLYNGNPNPERRSLSWDRVLRLRQDKAFSIHAACQKYWIVTAVYLWWICQFILIHITKWLIVKVYKKLYKRNIIMALDGLYGIQRRSLYIVSIIRSVNISSFLDTNLITLNFTEPFFSNVLIIVIHCSTFKPNGCLFVHAQSGPCFTV